MPTNALPNIPKDGCEDTPDLHSEGASADGLNLAVLEITWPLLESLCSQRRVDDEICKEERAALRQSVSEYNFIPYKLKDRELLWSRLGKDQPHGSFGLSQPLIM
ncbi:uncharacterized protein GJ701_005593 [Geothlypis trichas]